MPVSTTSTARVPTTKPTFGTSGTRPSGMTNTPPETSTGSPRTTGGGDTCGSISDMAHSPRTATAARSIALLAALPYNHAHERSRLVRHPPRRQGRSRDRRRARHRRCHGDPARGPGCTCRGGRHRLRHGDRGRAIDRRRGASARAGRARPRLVRSGAARHARRARRARRARQQRRADRPPPVLRDRGRGVGRGARRQPARRLPRLPARRRAHARAAQRAHRQPELAGRPAGQRRQRRPLRRIEGGHPRAHEGGRPRARAVRRDRQRRGARRDRGPARGRAPAGHGDGPHRRRPAPAVWAAPTRSPG